MPQPSPLPALTKPKSSNDYEFRFNKVYSDVFSSSARYVDVWGGRGRGGSHFGTDYALFCLTQPYYCRCYFIRQAFNDIRGSLWQDFKDRIADNDTLQDELFHLNENEMSGTFLPTGNRLNSKGAKKEGSRTAKLKSLAGATLVIIEEADEMSEDDFLQLDLSLRTVKAPKLQIIRIFNPPGKQHWIWSGYNLSEADVDGYYVAQPKSDSNILSVFSTYYDNRKNIDNTTAEAFERFRTKNPEYYYTIVRGLISEGMRGRVFKGWTAVSNEDFIKVDARSVYGLDFGTSSPAAIVEVKIVKNALYAREQNYAPLTTKEIAIKLLTLSITVNDLIVADSAEPLSISQLRNGWRASELTPEELEKWPGLTKGFNVAPAIKIAGSIVSGINKIKDYQVYYTEDSINLSREYSEYKWALDKNKMPTDQPIDEWNHGIDCLRMVVLAKGRLF